ncbi:MAG: type I restriction enzyme HsdR N-terminal domain-containing protein [Sediminibacterium sp.]|jgi:hypothetical protein|nr:type I restriction enzyme HsdR N-terminal domain-containing protein [Hydrotalea sp.]MCU0337525.1 type I restriction enzyme HsdR N-terminal domain-containing protein [Sediminibacterium sp.]
MLQIDFPNFNFRIEKKGEKPFIFDPVRRKMVALTPEEWVRQHWISYLTEVMQYPTACMAVEKQIKLYGQNRRCDIVVYSEGEPWMLIECKESTVQLNEKVLQQAIHYHATLQVTYLIITNGNVHAAFHFIDGAYIMISQIPSWPNQL